MRSYSNASEPQQVILSFSPGFPSQLGTSPNSSNILRQMVSIRRVWSILKCIDMSMIVYVVQVH